MSHQSGAFSLATWARGDYMIPSLESPLWQTLKVPEATRKSIIQRRLGGCWATPGVLDWSQNNGAFFIYIYISHGCKHIQTHGFIWVNRGHHGICVSVCIYIYIITHTHIYIYCIDHYISICISTHIHTCVYIYIWISTLRSHPTWLGKFRNSINGGDHPNQRGMFQPWS